MGSQLLLLTIYPPLFDPQRNEDKIAAKELRKINCELVWVEVTQDCLEDNNNRVRAPGELKDPASEFFGLTPIQYQGEIIQWLQREYGEHVQVQYTLYKDYLIAENQGRQSFPEYIASLSNLLLLNLVIKYISHEDAWYPPEIPEFPYICAIRICGTTQHFSICGL